MGMNGVWSRIPDTTKILLGGLALLGAGAAGGQWYATQRALPAIVASLDGRFTAFQGVTVGRLDIVNLRLAHLNCRAEQEDADRDPQVCEFILDQLPPAERQQLRGER